MGGEGEIPSDRRRANGARSVRPLPPGRGSYPARLAENTDFRKFSDIFRQVLSGTPAQRLELESYLEGLYRKGALVYGMHASPTALLTCMIFSYNGVHMHLVDGGNGGYALAATAMKQRVRRLRSSAGAAGEHALR